MITFTIDPWQVVQLIVAVVLPVLVGLVTTRTTSPGLKAALLAGLAVLSSLGTEALAANEAGEVYDLGQGLIFGLGTFIVAVAMHYGLWKPTGTSGLVQGVGESDKELTDVTEDDGQTQHTNRVHFAPADVESSAIDEAELPGDWSGADSDDVDYEPEH